MFKVGDKFLSTTNDYECTITLVSFGTRCYIVNWVLVKNRDVRINDYTIDHQTLCRLKKINKSSRSNLPFWF